MDHSVQELLWEWIGVPWEWIWVPGEGVWVLWAWIGANMKAAGPRRQLSSIQLYPSGVALQGNSRHTAPGGRYVNIRVSMAI